MSVAPIPPSPLYAYLATPPVCTGNDLESVVNWLKEGSYVVLYASNVGRFFHKCTTLRLTEEETKQFVDTRQIICLDVSKNPGLLDEDEWKSYIEDEGFCECTCGLKGRVQTMENIPYLFSLKL